MTKQQLLDFLLSVAADAEEENGQTSLLVASVETSKASSSSDSDKSTDVTVSPGETDESIKTKTRKSAVESYTKDAPSKTKAKKASATSDEKDEPAAEKTVKANDSDVEKETSRKTPAKREPSEATSTDEDATDSALDEEEAASADEQEADKKSKRVPSSTRKITATSAKKKTVRKIKKIKSVPASTKEDGSLENEEDFDKGADARVTVREIVPVTDDSVPSEEVDIVDEGEELEEDREREQEIVTGILEVMPEGYGFLRVENYIQSSRDIYVPPQFIRRFNLRVGDEVTGPVRQQRDNDRYKAIYYIREVNGMTPDKMIRRPHFDRLTPIYPNERYTLETGKEELSTRIIDLVCPIGKGQRGMIVSPPKAGKTILLQKIANAISVNNPEA
ncbi:MAG: hypothetical protein GX924_05895, partial [Clostridiaceae bacterium]|nr:hypothetical protein [Clostridiaceae bacterium]